MPRVLFTLQIVRGYMDQLKDKIEEETGRANEAEEEAKVLNTNLLTFKDWSPQSLLFKELHDYKEI